MCRKAVVTRLGSMLGVMRGAPEQDALRRGLRAVAERPHHVAIAIVQRKQLACSAKAVVW